MAEIEISTLSAHIIHSDRLKLQVQAASIFAQLSSLARPINFFREIQRFTREMMKKVTKKMKKKVDDEANCEE